MDEAHGVNGIQGHHHLRGVELCPFLRHVIGAGEVDQVTSWHVLHHHVEVVLILEGTAQLNNTGTSSHYSYYWPLERTVSNNLFVIDEFICVE